MDYRTVEFFKKELDDARDIAKRRLYFTAMMKAVLKQNGKPDKEILEEARNLVKAYEEDV